MIELNEASSGGSDHHPLIGRICILQTSGYGYQDPESRVPSPEWEVLFLLFVRPLS